MWVIFGPKGKGTLGLKPRQIIFSAKNGDENWPYAWHPLVLGMHERRLPTLNLNFYMDFRSCAAHVFAIEYMTTAVPQFRFIPVEKSITSEQTIST